MDFMIIMIIMIIMELWNCGTVELWNSEVL